MTFCINPNGAAALLPYWSCPSGRRHRQIPQGLLYFRLGSREWRGHADHALSFERKHAGMSYRSGRSRLSCLLPPVPCQLLQFPPSFPAGGDC